MTTEMTTEMITEMTTEMTTETEDMNLEELEVAIQNWHYARNLIHGATDLSQHKKLLEESDELYLSLTAKTSPIDDIGDMIVVLINIATRNNLSLTECMQHAYNDIKDRTGMMIDGIFVKQADLVCENGKYSRRT